jgi:hypothetical protein
MALESGGNEKHLFFQKSVWHYIHWIYINWINRDFVVRWNIVEKYYKLGILGYVYILVCISPGDALVAHPWVYFGFSVQRTQVFPFIALILIPEGSGFQTVGRETIARGAQEFSQTANLLWTNKRWREEDTEGWKVL